MAPPRVDLHQGHHSGPRCMNASRANAQRRGEYQKAGELA